MFTATAMHALHKHPYVDIGLFLYSSCYVAGIDRKLVDGEHYAIALKLPQAHNSMAKVN